MDFVAVLVIAIGLSMDAFAVSISNSLCFSNYTTRDGVKSAFTFGLFQGLMPILGFALGNILYDYIVALDHWLALILLGIIGVMMIKEGLEASSCDTEEKTFNNKYLIMQAIATSIDAFAIGVSFALLAVNVLGACLMIGIVTFLICVLGIYIGRKFGLLVGDKAQIFGGLLLIIIGLKTFVEHTWF